MRGAGIVLALAKYMACPMFEGYENWTPGAYIECEDCLLSKQIELEPRTICELFDEIDGTMEVTDESEFT